MLARAADARDAIQAAAGLLQDNRGLLANPTVRLALRNRIRQILYVDQGAEIDLVAQAWVLERLQINEMDLRSILGEEE